MNVEAVNAFIFWLADAEYRRPMNDPKRDGLFQARRRRFWVALYRMRKGDR